MTSIKMTKIRYIQRNLQRSITSSMCTSVSSKITTRPSNRSTKSPPRADTCSNLSSRRTTKNSRSRYLSKKRKKMRPIPHHPIRLRGLWHHNWQIKLMQKRWLQRNFQACRWKAPSKAARIRVRERHRGSLKLPRVGSLPRPKNEAVGTTWTNNHTLPEEVYLPIQLRIGSISHAVPAEAMTVRSAKGRLKDVRVRSG